MEQVHIGTEAWGSLSEERPSLPGRVVGLHALSALAFHTDQASLDSHLIPQGPLHPCGRDPDPNGGDCARGGDAV